MNEELEKKKLCFFQELIENEKATKTIEKYKFILDNFIEYLKDKELEKNTIITFKQKLKDENLSVATINNYVTVINKFLKYLKKEDLCIKLIKRQKKYSIEYSLSKADYSRLLRGALKQNEEDYIILRVLAETGVRVSEISNFSVEKINTTMIIDNKGKTREIIVTRKLLKDLRSYCRKNKIKTGPIIFNHKTKKPYSSSTIWRRLKKLAGVCRVNKNCVHPHAFRHYFGVRYLEQYPNDIAGLADLLGHSSLETTRIYTKLTNKEKELKLRNVKF